MGDDLAVLPTGVAGKVRGIEVHGDKGTVIMEEQSIIRWEFADQEAIEATLKAYISAVAAAREARAAA